MIKAKFEFKDKDGNLWYRYRGHSYCINPNTEWTLREQHKEAQASIDRLENTKCKSTEPAMVGLQKWWKYLEER